MRFVSQNPSAILSGFTHLHRFSLFKALHNLNRAEFFTPVLFSRRSPELRLNVFFLKQVGT